MDNLPQFSFMALTPSTSFTQDVDDIYAGVVADTTPDYGTGGNPVRGDAANYLLWCKTDENGDRVFNNPAFGNVLSIMSWDVETPTPGWYERMLMRIQPYNNSTSYVPEVSSGGIITQYAGIVYYPSTDTVYKCILASTGNTPTNTTYWSPVTDLSDLIGNTNISNTISNTFVRSIVDDGIKELFANMGRTCGCDEVSNKKAYKLYGMLVSADSQVRAGNYDDMQKIIAYIEAQLSQV